MPEYPWDPALPSAVTALFIGTEIARDVVITGGVALADWWSYESHRHARDGHEFTLQPRSPTKDLDTVVSLPGRRSHTAGQSPIRVVCSDPATLSAHLHARGWKPKSTEEPFTYVHAASHAGIAIDLVSYRKDQGSQQTVTSLVPERSRSAASPTPSIAHVLPPCLSALYFIQAFTHTQFERLGLRRHNHLALLLAKMSAVGTNLIRWRQVAAHQRDWPHDLQRLGKDAQDLEDLLHLQVRGSLAASREVLDDQIAEWAWCVHALMADIPMMDLPRHSMDRERMVLRSAALAVQQWLVEIKLRDRVARTDPQPPAWAGTALVARKADSRRTLDPPPIA